MPDRNFPNRSIQRGQKLRLKSWHDEYLKWICGFANAQGGKLIIGVDDSGNAVGVANAKKLLEDIPNKVVSLLGIVANVNLVRRHGHDTVEVDVAPSNVPISLRGVYHYPLTAPPSATATRLSRKIDMDTTIDQTIEELREAAATLEQGGLPERFAAGHGIQSRRFRFEWQDEVLSLDFDLPCARLLSDEETQREEGAEAAAACRMGMLLLAARRDGTLLQEGEATLSATCGD